MNINRSIRKNMKDHFTLYIFVSVLFLIGVVFGALLVNALSMVQKQEISQYLGLFFEMMEQGGGLQGEPTLANTFGHHVKWILLIWLSGISVIGLPFILIIDFLKGVLIGFTVGYLVAQLSWKGLLFALVGVAPQNLIILPAMIMMSVSAIAFSMFIIKNRLVERKGSIAQTFMLYVSQGMTMVALMFAISLFEMFITPSLMSWVAPMIIAVS